MRRQPVAAIYDGQPRVLCPHVGVGRKAGATSFVINLAGEATVSSRFRQRARVYGVALEWRDSAKSSCNWHTESRSKRQTCIDEVDFDIDAQPGDDPQNGQ
jgi:hypothetical protein